ncbi:MAG TPA: hypothetical protein V6D08_02520 [Candidatus Obscuribacterales bacterium]
MFQPKTVKRFFVCCLTASVLAGLFGLTVKAQDEFGGKYPVGESSGTVPGGSSAKSGGGGVIAPAVPVPLVKPKVDQLGQMEGVPVPDRTGLVVMLFLQVVALVVVAIALAGHLSLPAKRKTPKA